MEEGPETIIWIVTSRCNLNCRHCYTLPYRFERDLSTDIIKKIIEEAADVGVEHIHYTGGEPLLRNDIFDVLKHTIELGIDTSLFTNATLVNDEIAKKLARTSVTIYTSIDGHNREIYESIRGLGTWSKFLKGVKKLIEYGLYVHMNISITELNWIYVDKIIRKAIELGASSVSLIPAMPAGNALKFNTYIRPEHFTKALIKADEVAKELGIYVSVWCSPFTPIVVKSDRILFSNCRDWNVMDISPSGRVLICDVLNIDVGRITELSVRSAWKRLKSNELIKRIENPELEKEPCRSCPIKSLCKGGCYARAYIMFKSVDMPDPLCPRVANYRRKVRVT